MLAAFFIFGGLVAYASAVEKSALKASISGGDNFAYVEAQNPMLDPNTFGLQVTNTTGTIYGIGIHIQEIDSLGKPVGEKMYVFERPEMPKNSIGINAVTVTAGTYRFDFQARNARWSQLLVIGLEGKVFTQFAEIHHEDGRRLYGFDRIYPKGS
jgi:hypothetical protein